MTIESLYQELILDHFKRPRNRGVVASPDADVAMSNPTCGDEVRLQLAVRDGIVESARFEGTGCSISQASISMMTQLVQGRKIADVPALAARFTAMMHGDAEASRDKSLGDLRALAGVSKYPVRVKCALLGWNALSEALAQVHRKEGS